MLDPASHIFLTLGDRGAAAPWRELARKFLPSLLALRSPRVAGVYGSQTVVGPILALATASQPLCQQKAVTRNVASHQKMVSISLYKPLCYEIYVI